MSGDKYFITDQHATYFITCTVIHWIDLFTKKKYRNILNLLIIVSTRKIYNCILRLMSNHVHLIAQCCAPGTMSCFLRDFYKFRSKKFIETVQNTNEIRAEWLLDKFSFEAGPSVKKFPVRTEHYSVETE